jgi:hypothetical protein
MRPRSPWGLVNLPKYDVMFMANGPAQAIEAFMSYYVTASSPGPCLLAESFDVPTFQCNFPHGVGVDYNTGELYVACDGMPKAAVRRYIPNIGALEKMLSSVQPN